MSELKTNERLALIRNEAIAELGALDNATKVGTGEFLMETANGVAKVTISAIKDADFDIAGAKAEFEASLVEKAVKAEEKAAAKAAKDAEKAAAKAAKAEKA